MEATTHPLPEEDLAFAKTLGARVIIEQGDVIKTLINVARKMSIDYFVTGRSHRSRLSFTWRLPVTEQIQRAVPRAVVLIV